MPSEWEYIQLIKTPQCNPHDSSPSINISWSEKLHVLINKSIILTFLTSNCCFQFVHTSPLSITLLSSGKKSSCLNQERNMHISTCTVYRQEQSKCVGGFLDVCWQQGNECDYELWSHILSRNDDLKFKCIYLRTHNFSLHKILITCRLLSFNQLFGLSFWRHPFTAEDPLLRKWYNATFLQICSDEETNSSTSWMCTFKWHV